VGDKTRVAAAAGEVPIVVKAGFAWGFERPGVDPRVRGGELEVAEALRMPEEGSRDTVIAGLVRDDDVAGDLTEELGVDVAGCCGGASRVGGFTTFTTDSDDLSSGGGSESFGGEFATCDSSCTTPSSVANESAGGLVIGSDDTRGDSST
jgi:hypothetical protein